MKSVLMLALLLGPFAARPGLADDDDRCDESDGACNEAAILAADDALQAAVAERGIAAAFAGALADDATLIATRQPLITGKAAIVAFLGSSISPAATLTWIKARGDVSAAGDVGYTFGWTTFTAPGGTATPGHYMAMWRRSRGHGHTWALET